MSSIKINNPIYDWVKAICTVALTIVLCLKIYSVPTTITIDFPTLLSLLLALFSVGLSALFYFKATDTSNTFYDNTYKFTKDIAELLVKIESGFGERLRNLDEGYSSMRDYLQSSTRNPSANIDITKEKIETEQQEIEKVRAERDEIVNKLLERSQLQQAEKDQILNQLKSKEQELEKSQEEIANLNRTLTVERVLRKNRANDSFNIDSSFSEYTYFRVIKEIGEDNVISASASELYQLFDKIIKNLAPRYIKDLEDHGYFDSGLTFKGARFLKELVKKRREEDTLLAS